jgi:hypothetical protein
VEQELEAEGVPYIGGTDPAYRREFRQPEDFEAIANGSLLDPDVGVVLSGLDFHSNYLKTAIAFQYLQQMRIPCSPALVHQVRRLRERSVGRHCLWASRVRP